MNGWFRVVAPLSRWFLFVMMGGGCASSSGPGKGGAGLDTGPTEEGSAEGTDGVEGGAGTEGGEGTDGTDGTDGGTDGSDGGDTGEVPCAAGLQVSLEQDGTSIALSDDGELSFGVSAARTSPRQRTLLLSNPCPGRIRFLGHPDEWTVGDGFGVVSLPPVLLEPGENATIVLDFEPGDPGIVDGRLDLPHDQPGSPFSLSLRGEVSAPLLLALVGEGGRRTVSLDYGDSFVLDTWSTTEAHTNALQRGLCAGHLGFLAVGGSDERRVAWSEDGLSWAETGDGTGWIGDCAAGDGRYVVAGGFGILGVSTDGGAFSRGGSSSGSHLRAVAFGDGQFVAVGADRRMVTEDGSMILVDLSVPGTNVDHIAFGVDPAGVPTFVAVGADGLVATSRDGGHSWTDQNIGSGGTLSTVIHTGERFLTTNGGSLYGSADGLTWALVNASTVAPLAGLGDLVLGAVGSTLYRSLDGGFSWSVLRASDGGPGYSDATFSAVVEPVEEP